MHRRRNSGLGLQAEGRRHGPRGEKQGRACQSRGARAFPRARGAKDLSDVPNLSPMARSNRVSTAAWLSTSLMGGGRLVAPTRGLNAVIASSCATRGSLVTSQAAATNAPKAHRLTALPSVGPTERPAASRASSPLHQCRSSSISGSSSLQNLHFERFRHNNSRLRSSPLRSSPLR